MTTIYDIAARANVSAMTVSRVINDTGRISEKTRAKVKQVMEELHYVPNQMARSLVLQQTRILFLLISDITNPFFTTLSRGAEDAANNHGFHLLFGNSDESLEKEAGYIHTILSTRVDGVLISPAGDPSITQLEILQNRNVPFVLLDREVPGISCDIVLGDSEEAARQLMNHLLSSGHARIALLNGSSKVSSARLRLNGYKDVLQHHNIPIDPSLIHEASFGPQADLSRIEAWFDSLDPMPSAIVAGNNVLAVEMISLLNKRSLRVPEDISIVCFDDFGPYSGMDPFITVAAQQAYQFGFLGMQMLIERIMNRDEAADWKKIVLPAELIVRRSVSEKHTIK